MTSTKRSPVSKAKREPRVPFSFHLANCTASDAWFLGKVCALFCDPEQRVFADGLRRGKILLARGPQGELIPRHVAEFTSDGGN